MYYELPIHITGQPFRASSRLSASRADNSSPEWSNDQSKLKFVWPLQYGNNGSVNDSSSTSSHSNDEDKFSTGLKSTEGFYPPFGIRMNYDDDTNCDLLNELMLQDFNEMIDSLLDTGENRRQLYENLIKLLNQDQEAEVPRMRQGPSLLRTFQLSKWSVIEAASAPPAPLNFKVFPHIPTGSNELLKASNHGDRSQVLLQYDASKKGHTHGSNPRIIPKCRVDDVLQRIDEVRWQLNQLEAERKKLEASDTFEQGSNRYGNVNEHCAVVKNAKKIDVLLRDCLQEHKKVAKLCGVALKSSKKLRQNLSMKTAFDEFQIAVLAVMELRESSLCKDKKSPGGEGMNGGMMILGQSIRKARTALWAVSVVMQS